MRSLLAVLVVVPSLAVAGGLPPRGRGVSAPRPPEAAYPLVGPQGSEPGWQPMSGTAPAEVVQIGGRRAVRMPCNLAGTKMDRASWDLSVKLDLAACQGLQFAFFCADATPVSSFSFYLHSGDGWYAAHFGQATKGWNQVAIEKTATRMEEKPSGWGSIDILRISAWRGTNVDTEFTIANLGLLGADAPIAVIRGESVAKNSPDESQSVGVFTEAVAHTLDRLGLSYAVVSDLDVTPERLKGKKIAILPHNPAMPDEVADQLIEFLKGGGKLVAFYGLHSRLRDAIGIRGGQHVQQKYRGYFAEIRTAGEGGIQGVPPVVRQMSWNISHAEAVEGKSRVAANWFDDKGESTGEAAILVSDNAILMTHVLLADDLANKDRLILSMLGHFEPKLWEQVAKAALQRIGRFAPYGAPEGAFDELLRKAAGLVAEGKFPEAIAAAAEAHKAEIEAFCLAQKPLEAEHRAFWCHSAFGPAGMTWDESIKVLADNGFTAILPNMLWGGLAYYESSVLPVAPEVAEKGDQIAQCVAACRKYGVECHVWKVNYNMSGRAPKDFVDRMKREGRTQVMFDGKPEDRWLCPSHPDNQKLEVDAMAEVATKYDVDGIHFDYIRYPGPEGCFCPGCRERFEKVLGAKVANWPADTRNDPAIAQKWLDFRREQITKVVAAVAEQVRKVKPKVRISAAVFGNWAVDRDRVGQDWKLWCERGYLDFVCPMDYTSNDAQFENMVRQQVAWAGKVPCYPGIGLSVWEPGDNIVRLIDFIGITRKLGTKGFTIFEYRAPEARDIVPLCGKGITRKE